MAENEFKKLAHEEKLPPEHKEAVLQSIDTLKLIGNMLDMFSLKQAQTDLSMLENLSGSSKSKRSAKKSADEGDNSSDNSNDDNGTNEADA